MKRKILFSIVLLMNISIINAKSDDYYQLVLFGLNKSYVNHLYTSSFSKYKLTDNKGYVSKDIFYYTCFDVSYSQFQSDSILFSFSVPEFFRSDIGIIRHLLKNQNDFSQCGWVIGWSENFNPVNSVVDYTADYLKQKRYSALELIYNYFLFDFNLNELKINVYRIPEEDIDNLYSKIDVFLEKNKNDSLEEIREKFSKEFKIYDILFFY